MADTSRLHVPGLEQTQVAALAAWAAETPEVMALYVFGSRAKGTHRSDSDVDVAVSVATAPGLTNKNTYDQHWLEWVTELSERLHADVDLLRLAADETPKTTAAVAEAGVLVYSRNRHA